MRDLEALYKVALEHSVHELGGNLEGTLATLEADPIYELFPVGLKLTGMDKVRRYYTYFMENVLDKFIDGKVYYESRGLPGHAKESFLTWRDKDGQVRRTQMMTILVYGETKLRGERIYADEDFLRFLFGPLWAEMEPHDEMLP